ncbi:type II toxin-antitoxin system RelE/ParE family toxin [Sphingomonas sp.]|uniref:type II toxin-antitoxin system RelE family toxin n=1 Tax=Sphingomonas sp. TaxID=28214 RepID=UPI002DBA6154|nr:type II toxin-antitoxin system RelE/ParE family toxin [Sphingomonas sp.]HEU4969249.1 type II toxin-antitoxin system RelE/ParE family toxin [Sphingomonas sp.]
MAWTVRFSDRAEKRLRNLDRKVSSRIIKTIEDIASLDDPRQRGKALTGRFAGLWRYRVGDWRVIAKLEHDRLIIIVIDTPHRSEAYR